MDCTCSSIFGYLWVKTFDRSTAEFWPSILDSSVPLSEVGDAALQSDCSRLRTFKASRLALSFYTRSPVDRLDKNDTIYIKNI